MRSIDHCVDVVSAGILLYFVRFQVAADLSLALGQENLKPDTYFEKQLPSGAIFFGKSPDYDNVAYTAIGYPGLAIIDMHGGESFAGHYYLTPKQQSTAGVNGKIARALHDHSPVIRTALSYACDETGQGTPEFYDRLAGGTLEKVIKVLPRRNSWELNNAATDWPETHRSAEGDSRTPGVKMDREVRSRKFGYLVVYEKQPDGRWAYAGPYTWDRLYVDPLVFPPARTFEVDDETRLGMERYRWGVCLIATSPDLTFAEKEKRLKGRPDGRRLVREANCPGREELIDEMVLRRTASDPARQRPLSPQGKVVAPSPSPAPWSGDRGRGDPLRLTRLAGILDHNTHTVFPVVQESAGSLASGVAPGPARYTAPMGLWGFGGSRGLGDSMETSEKTIVSEEFAS